MASVEAGVLYGTESIKLSSTSTTAVLTVPDVKGMSYEVTQVIVVDEDGSGGTAKVYRYDKSADTEYMIAYNSAVPSTGNLDIEFKPLHLDQEDELRVAGAADQQVTVNFMINDRSTAPFDP